MVALVPKGNLGDNLISCKEHIDKNSDMLCDFCGLELPVSDYLKQKSIETVASDNSIVKITGNMPENTMIKAANISNVEAVTLAKNYIPDVSLEDILCVYDISMISNDRK